MPMKEYQLLNEMRNKTIQANKDNISRTVMYEQFFKHNKEIKWSLLAGMVSRNAGWNITDLESEWFQTLLKKRERQLLFRTFERANWTIFADAYPQLLWYEAEKQRREPRYQYLAELGVSQFMQDEWRRFFERGDEDRLCTALIINEQYMLEQTVMKHPIYRDKVFGTFRYFLEEHAHMSYVLFPTINGKIYGLYVRNFKDVRARIWLGKQLQRLLFHPSIYELIFTFALKTPPTGSRNDYYQYMGWATRNTSPVLRTTYPIVPHSWHVKEDWSMQQNNVEVLFTPIRATEPVERTNWLQRKYYELYMMMKVKQWFSTILNREKGVSKGKA